MVSVLLEHGALPSFLTLANETAMDLAVQNNRRYVEQVLNAAAADEQALKVSSTSLHRAAAIGRLGWIRRCIESGMDPNSMNASGITPLELAILHNHPLCVYMLLSAGADLCLPNSMGESPLHIAAQRGFASVVTAMTMFHPSAVSLVANGSTPLHRSASRGQVLCTSILVSMGADCTAVDAKGRMPLELAAPEHPGKGP